MQLFRLFQMFMMVETLKVLSRSMAPVSRAAWTWLVLDRPKRLNRSGFDAASRGQRRCAAEYSRF